MSVTDGTELRRASVRLAIRFAALILVLFAVLISVTFLIVEAGQAEATNNTLANAGLIDSPHDAPRNVSVAIVQNGTTLVSGGVPSWFPVKALLDEAESSAHPIQSTKTVDGHTFAVRTSADHGRIVQTAMDTQENQEELGRLALGLIGAGMLAVVGAGFIAAFMARRSMRPMLDALALQRRFVADASHELRTPLTLLSTRAQLLRRRVGDEESEGKSAPTSPVASGLDEIVEDSRELTAILEDLLIAADPRENSERSELDLVALAADVVASLQAEADTRAVMLSRTGSDSPVVVYGAKTALRRMCTAVVSNALDHARSTVVVDIHAENRIAVVQVTDDGAGFPDGMTTRAFERFASSRPTHETAGGSRHYGLGLALVAEVASQHAGSVSIERMPPGDGARIRVTLPLSVR